MATHVYDNPGPKETHTNTNIGGVIGIPVTTYVSLVDGTDHLTLLYTDLDALDESIRLMEQARAGHIAALCDGRSQMVTANDLRTDDLAIIDGELVMIDTTVIDGQYLIVRYGRKYAGTYDMTGDRSIRLVRTTRVKRLLADPSLAVVR